MLQNVGINVFFIGDIYSFGRPSMILPLFFGDSTLILFCGIHASSIPHTYGSCETFILPSLIPMLHQCSRDEDTLGQRGNSFPGHLDQFRHEHVTHSWPRESGLGCLLEPLRKNFLSVGVAKPRLAVDNHCNIQEKPSKE